MKQKTLLAAALLHHPETRRACSKLIAKATFFVNRTRFSYSI
jgi:hypothetical protein